MHGGVLGEGLPRKRETRNIGGRDSLEKGKYLRYSHTTARVNAYCKLSSFFPMLF